MSKSLEAINRVMNYPDYERIKEVVKTDLKKFMIGDSYNDEGWWNVCKISAGWAYAYLEAILYQKEIKPKQIMETLMSFDVTLLHNAQLLMDYIFTYERMNSKGEFFLLDTQKLFNKLRTEMPVEFRKNRAIWLPLQEMQEKGLDFKW